MARLHLRNKPAEDPTPKKYLNRDLKRNNKKLKILSFSTILLLICSISVNLLFYFHKI